MIIFDRAEYQWAGCSFDEILFLVRDRGASGGAECHYHKSD